MKCMMDYSSPFRAFRSKKGSLQGISDAFSGAQYSASGSAREDMTSEGNTPQS